MIHINWIHIRFCRGGSDRQGLGLGLALGSPGRVQVPRDLVVTSEGKMEQGIGSRIGTASVVMRALRRTVVVKRKLSQKTKVSIYRSIYELD